METFRVRDLLQISLVRQIVSQVDENRIAGCKVGDNGVDLFVFEEAGGDFVADCVQDMSDVRVDAENSAHLVDQDVLSECSTMWYDICICCAAYIFQPVYDMFQGFLVH